MTDPLLAEIDALLKIMEFRGTYNSDEVKNILLGIRQKIIADRERMINKYESYITQYGYDIGSSGHDVDDYLDDIRKIIKGQEEKKK